jgi:hypothetical protein
MNPFICISEPLTDRQIAFMVELFPFHVRSKGIAVFLWFGRMAAFFNQFVNPIGIANAGSSFSSAFQYAAY